MDIQPLLAESGTHRQYRVSVAHRHCDALPSIGTLDIGTPATMQPISDPRIKCFAALPPNADTWYKYLTLTDFAYQSHHTSAMARTPRVSASPRPSSPSRPPSRQSSQIITPVKSHLNYVRTNNDTRRSLVNSSRVQKSVKKRKIQAVADTDDSDHSSDDPEEIPERHSAAQSEANLDVEILDLAQNSDEENQKANKSKKKPTRAAAVTGFDKVELYYEPPRRAEGVVDGPKLFFKCKWCSKPYKKGKDT
ncbi:hypothetical protein H4Q26_010449 [Puccinia striiformis f. sp. tritici PST-130]|nr:hypothetical protein H4Q26_010449 [Puccinia striiformis f. sp. tritici PST-130]